MLKNIIGLHTKIAVIYVRYSSHNQREESIDAQIRACKAYAESMGYTVIEIYSDSAQSATNDNRAEFQRMIADAKKKKFQYVIVHKLDRFSRDKYDAVTYKRELKINGITLISVTENLDGSPESLMLESVIEGMAAYYSANLAREVMKGLKENAYQCKHTGGFPALGYDVDPITKKYVINEDEAKIVKIIFEKYSNGIGYLQILEYLNGMGYRTKAKKPFAKNSIHHILKNVKYIGTYIYNRKKDKSANGKRGGENKPREEWIVIEDGVPAIIDKEVFNTVQQKMAQNRDNGGKHKAKQVYVLSGLIFCGECGSPYYGNSRICGRHTVRYVSYRCSNRDNRKGCKNKEIRKEYVENFVLDSLYSNLFNALSIQKLSRMLTEYALKQSEDNIDELNIANAELSSIADKINVIIKLVAETGISIDTVRDNLRELEERKIFLENIVRELTMHKQETAIAEEKIAELINQSKDFVKTKNLAECMQFIKTYINKVVINDETVDLLFNINLPNEDVDQIEQFRSSENIKTIQREYK